MGSRLAAARPLWALAVAWALLMLLAASRDVFCYFDNTDKRHAPDNARELMALLGVDWRPAPAPVPVPRRKRTSPA